MLRVRRVMDDLRHRGDASPVNFYRTAWRVLRVCKTVNSTFFPSHFWYLEGTLHRNDIDGLVYETTRVVEETTHGGALF